MVRYCPRETCRGPLVSYSSLNIRVCIDCGYSTEWKLKKDQKPLVKHQR